MSNYYILTKDKETFSCDYFKEMVQSNIKGAIKKSGDFTIKNDSIYAYVPIYLALTGHRFELINFNYRGYIKNRDTITDWKVIKPYPKDITKNAVSLNPRLFNPQTLYFVKTDAVKCLQINQIK